MVIAAHAASWVVLAVSYARIAPLAARSAPPAAAGASAPTGAVPGGWAVIRSSPVLPGLLALSFVFYLLYGPVEVVLPVHVATDLHGSAALLGLLLWMALAALFAGAVISGPWMSLSMAVLQDARPPAALAQVIAARSSLLIIAAPLGTALGGPIVAVLGARGTLLASALATVALGVVTVGFLAARRRRARR